MHEFITAAFTAANAHNVLEPENRAHFAAAITAGNALDAEGWAWMIVYDLSMRCRSFTPPVLTRLYELGQELNASAEGP
jgi:hypothetical protein